MPEQQQQQQQQGNISPSTVHAQIENRQGLESFADILAVADGVLLSRGNLGLDVAAEKMAMVQKVSSRLSVI